MRTGLKRDRQPQRMQWGRRWCPCWQGEGRRPDSWRRREVLTARHSGLEFILESDEQGEGSSHSGAPAVEQAQQGE